MQAAQRLADPTIETRLFDKAAFSPTTYPRLEAVFERMVVASAENLREVCTVPPQYVFEGVRAERFGAILDALAEQGMVAIFSVPAWSARILFAVDREFIYALPEILFGADGSEPGFDERRRFSQIEKNIVRAALSSAAGALQSAFAPIADLAFVFERIETNMDLAVIDDRNGAAVVATFGFRALGRSGTLRIVIPQSAIRSSRAGSRAGAQSEDANWRRQMEDGIKSAEVTLRAVLEEKRATLREISELKVGQVLSLNAGIDSRIKLECNDETLFLCHVGQSGGAYTLRIEETLKRPGQVQP